MAEIEDLREAKLKQPPSMYISLTTPLEVWLVPDQVSYKSPTLFYKVPQVLPFDSIIRLPSPSFNAEVASTTIKAEPRMARLLEKSGINLLRNCRLQPPPPVCEEWWEEAEKIVRKNGKRRSKPRLKYGLGFISFDSEDDEHDDPQ